MHAASVGDGARPRFEILGPIVDEMVDAERSEFAVFGGRGRADDARADVLGDLRRCDPDAAADRMDQNRLAFLQSAHHDEELPGGDVVYRDRGGVDRGQSRGPREHLVCGRADHIRIAAEPGRRHHFAADPARIETCADGVDPTGDLVAGHDRKRRHIGIDPHAAHDIGEIDAASLDANPISSGRGSGSGACLTSRTSGAPALAIQI